MPKRVSVTLGLLAGFVLSGCMTVVTPLNPPDPPPTRLDTSAIYGTYASPLNQYRAAAGLPLLSENPALSRAAKAHANDMAARNFFNHRGSNGSTPPQRARAQGYRVCQIAENIGRGYDSFEVTLDSWMRSPKHKRNVLFRPVTEFGVGRGPGNRWVLVLAQPGC